MEQTDVASSLEKFLQNKRIKISNYWISIPVLSSLVNVWGGRGGGGGLSPFLLF